MRSLQGDTVATELISKLIVAPTSMEGYDNKQELLRYHSKLYVGSNGDLRIRIFKELHDSGIGGYSGMRATVARIKQFFYWPTLSSDVKQWVAECSTCQHDKFETIPSPGLLQPLPIPTAPWEDISMDFIDGLPNSQGKSVIWVVVDKLTKFSHFIPLKHPYTTSTLASIYMDQVHKLHGMLLTIVCDRDKVFVSHFWQALFQAVGTRVAMSTAYHPQIDGQTERIN